MKKILYTLLIMLAALTGFAQQEYDSIADASKADPTVVVGAIGGTVDVSALGGAVYTIPIQVPDGIAGMQPNLSIVYNSQSDNGLLGWGWNLGGVSAITRVGTTLYHDGFIHGINFSHDMNDRDALDRYALDGQRLMVVNGLPDGANGCEYRKEIDDMSKVISYRCDTTSGPAYFKVWMTDGKVAYYGSKNHSRIGLNQRMNVCVWLLDSIVDSNGNYVTYRYEKNKDSYYLTKILYTGNYDANVWPLYEIQLNYSERTDTRTSFIGYNLLRQDKCLHDITVYNTTDTKNNPLWQYAFTYSGGDGVDGYIYKKLEEITLNCGNRHYNSTRIIWDYRNDFIHPYIGYYGVYNDLRGCVMFPGDFNGDGYDDVLVARREGGNSGRFDRAEILLNLKNGFPVVSESFDLGEYVSWIYTDDFDGDGMDDILVVNRERRGFLQRDKVSFNVKLMRKNSDGTLRFSCKDFGGSEYKISSSKRDAVILGDFEGNGKIGFIAQFTNDDKDVENLSKDSLDLRRERSYYFHYDSEVGMTEEKFYETLDADCFYPADYNGDGITEILYSYRGTTYMAKLLIDSNNKRHGYNLCGFAEPKDWIDCFTGDFNADGKTDALFYFGKDGDDNHKWKFYHSRGLGFSPDCIEWFPRDMAFTENYHFSLDCFTGGTREYVKVMDVDGDGSADVMYNCENGGGQICFGPLRREGNYAPFSTIRSFGGILNNAQICFGNFYGEEITSSIGYGWYGNDARLCVYNRIFDRYGVTGIVDGLENKYSFKYSHLVPSFIGDHSDDFFTLDQEEEDTLMHIYSRPLPIRALLSVERRNENASTPVEKIIFRYKNVLIHTYGHGILGFAETKKSSYVGNQLQEIVKSKYSTSVMGDKCLPALEQVIVYGPSNEQVSETKYKYTLCQSLRNDKQFMLLPDYQVTWYNDVDQPSRFLKQSLTGYTYESDAGGLEFYKNIVHLKKQDNGVSGNRLPSMLENLIGLYDFQSSDEYEYIDDISSLNYIVDRPKRIFSTTHRFGESEENNVYAQKEYEYGSSQHPMLPTKITGKHGQEDSNAPNEPHVADGYTTCDAYEYYPTGAVKTHTLSAPASPGLPTVTDTYAYSNNFYFLRNVTNAKGYVTSWEYNEDSYGNLRKETDANGLITKYDNDPLGVHSETIYPDQTRTVTEKLWVESNDQYAPERARYYVVTKQFDTNSASMGESRTYYDAACRELRSISFGLEGMPIFTDKKYNGRGLVSGISDPYFKDAETSHIKWTSFEYDGFGRNTVTNFADGTSQSVNYDGLTVSTTASPAEGSNLPVQTTSQTVNVMGWTMQSVDANGTPVNYAYYADGAMKYAQIGEDPNTRVSMEYDNARNRTKLVDPDYGTMTSVYNAYGQLEMTHSPRNVSTVLHYDELGRLDRRTESMRGGERKITQWNYSDTGTEKGLLQSIDYDNGSYVAFYKYDNLKRVASITENIDGNSYTTSYGYHPATGRLFETTYPTGFAVRNLYTRWGHLAEITDVSDGRALWQTHEKNAYGQTVAFEMGKGTYFGRYDYYDDTHLLGKQSVKTSQEILQSMVYHYDDFRNLDARNDNVHGMKETFQYDRLNRLETITLNEQLTSTIKYDSYGRMEYKEADGRMVFDATGQNCYQAAKPHALREAVMNVNPFNAAQQDVTYTMFDKVKTIEQNGRRLAYTYGYDHQRVKAVETQNGTVTREKIYVGNCEFITDPDGSHRLTFLSGPMGVFAVAEEINGNTELHYVMKDHLGSWTAIADAYGNVEQEFSYDAWGNSRDPYTWTGSNANRCMFDRGFTGHEILYDFGLINMNGRCYDPVMSSFLSVDRYVQNPSNSQNFNRYSYCLNNPLRFTDPSGWQCRPTPQKNNYIDYTYQYLEPRDGDIGSPYMVNYFLNGVDCSGGGGGFGGGGGSSVSYGYAVNHPQFSAEQQCSIIRNWQDNPTAMNSWMLWYAGLSDVNVHETYFGAERKTILEWECGGVSHTADFGYENVGGNRFFSQTVSNIGGDGRYMPPGYDYAGSGIWSPSQGLTNASIAVQSFALGNGAKTELMDWAVRTNYKSARSWGEFRNLRATQKEFRYVNTLGKTGSKYLRVCKGLGTAAAALSTGITTIETINYYNEGGRNWEVYAKSGLDVVMTGVAFLGPIGFAVSSVYFITDLATDGFWGWGSY